MKRYLLLLPILLISLTSSAQSGIGINFCENTKLKSTETTLTLKQLLECAELTVNNKNYTIYSYTVTINLSGVIKKLMISGNKFSDKLTASIKKDKPNKIYFEEVLLMDEKGNKIYGATHTIIIKK
jgi:hypothetical protein